MSEVGAQRSLLPLLPDKLNFRIRDGLILARRYSQHSVEVGTNNRFLRFFIGFSLVAYRVPVSLPNLQIRPKKQRESARTRGIVTNSRY
jgi:hypothetical protein